MSFWALCAINLVHNLHASDLILQYLIFAFDKYDSHKCDPRSTYLSAIGAGSKCILRDWSAILNRHMHLSMPPKWGKHLIACLTLYYSTFEYFPIRVLRPKKELTPFFRSTIKWEPLSVAIRKRFIAFNVQNYNLKPHKYISRNRLSSNWKILYPICVFILRYIFHFHVMYFAIGAGAYSIIKSKYLEIFKKLTLSHAS